MSAKCTKIIRKMLHNCTREVLNLDSLMKQRLFSFELDEATIVHMHRHLLSFSFQSVHTQLPPPCGYTHIHIDTESPIKRHTSIMLTNTHIPHNPAYKSWSSLTTGGKNVQYESMGQLRTGGAGIQHEGGGLER